mmetsp:Transcript_27745/g.70723  ORF Transcript_27745/g.70723 Transcript_27745/m.70723 type:complete len:252 (+) Transcript_27745:188-943(+)
MAPPARCSHSEQMAASGSRAGAGRGGPLTLPAWLAAASLDALRAHLVQRHVAGVRAGHHLKHARPLLARHKQPLAHRVVRDAVEHVHVVMLRVALVQAVAQPVQQHPLLDAASGQVDDRDALGLPHVGPQLAVNHLELIQPLDRPPLILDRHLAHQLHGVGVDERHVRRAVCGDEQLAVGGQAPPVTQRPRHLAHLLELPALHPELEDGACLPRELVQHVAQLHQALAKPARVKLDGLLHLARVNHHLAHS